MVLHADGKGRSSGAGRDFLAPGHLWIPVGCFYRDAKNVYGFLGRVGSPDAAIVRLRQPFFPYQLRAFESTMLLSGEDLSLTGYDHVWVFGHLASPDLAHKVFGANVEIHFYDQCRKDWYVQRSGDESTVFAEGGCLLAP